MAERSEFAEAVYILQRDPGQAMSSDDSTNARAMESAHAVRTLHIIMTGAPAATVEAARAEVLRICEELVSVLTA